LAGGDALAEDRSARAPAVMGWRAAISAAVPAPTPASMAPTLVQM